ncbi:MAG TPA: hypothetical protein VNI34_10940 [Candidatus Nitrosotalea sp.]|nr:hypothetical protein [Candidatus Nitrosotalea sp.]
MSWPFPTDRGFWAGFLLFLGSMAYVLTQLALHHGSPPSGHGLLALGSLGGIAGVNVVYARLSVLTKGWSTLT